jgi:hypothetical protein
MPSVDVTFINREWIRLRQAYGATRLRIDTNTGLTNRKTNRGWTQIYADRFSSFVQLKEFLPIFRRRTLRPVMDLPAKQTKRHRGSTTGSFHMNRSRSRDYLRKSASICGSALVSLNPFSRPFAVNPLPSASI